METGAVPRTQIWSTVTVPIVCHLIPTHCTQPWHLLWKPIKHYVVKNLYRVWVHVSVTFSFATLWENGQVPSACLHVPRRNLHMNNRNKPKKAEANWAAKWEELLVLEVFLPCFWVTCHLKVFLQSYPQCTSTEKHRSLMYNVTVGFRFFKVYQV